MLIWKIRGVEFSGWAGDAQDWAATLHPGDGGVDSGSGGGTTQQQHMEAGTEWKGTVVF